MTNGKWLSVTAALALLTGCQSWSVRDIDSLPPTAALPTQSEQGWVEVRYFDDIQGNKVEALTSLSRYPDNPDEIIRINRLEVLDSRADVYGTLVRGYIEPPSSGRYRFFVSGDDETQLFFSQSSSPSGVELVASVPSYSSRNQFDKFSSQASPYFELDSGQRYYFEIRHKEGIAGDHFSVAWEGPGFGRTIVDGQFLYSFSQGSTLYPEDELSTAGYALGYRVGFFDGDKGLPFNPQYPPLDEDLDGIYDNWEVYHGLDPANPSDAMSDRDGDFLTAYDEFWLGSGPTDPDTDGDGIPDGVEFAYGLDPLNPADAHDDMDGDGFTNLEEYLAGTDMSDPVEYPAARLELVPGMVGQYFTGRDFDAFVVARMDERVHFDWGSGSPADEIPVDVFSARWSGYFVPPHESGSREYEFRVRRDDGARVFLGEDRILNVWSGGSTSRYYSAVRAVETEGPIPLVIEYNEGYGGARVFFEIVDVQTGQRLQESVVLRTYALEADASGDATGDGVPDVWALRYGLDPWRLDPAAVLNSQGVSVRQAFDQGLNPWTLASGAEWTGQLVSDDPVPQPPPVEQAPPPVTSELTVTLSWSAPGTRLDGSSIALSEIESYEILYGTSEGQLSQRVTVAPEVTEYTFEGLAAGTWYFAVRVKDSAGLWSPNSDIVSRTLQ